MRYHALAGALARRPLPSRLHERRQRGVGNATGIVSCWLCSEQAPRPNCSLKRTAAYRRLCYHAPSRQRPLSSSVRPLWSPHIRYCEIYCGRLYDPVFSLGFYVSVACSPHFSHSFTILVQVMTPGSCIFSSGARSSGSFPHLLGWCFTLRSVRSTCFPSSRFPLYIG